MNYAALPPEINSIRIYSGPGSAPMRAAAAAWAGLSAELHSAAAAYESVIAELAGRTWLGPASAAMSTAAASYVGWLAAIAAQVEQTTAQASAAAAAYEAVFAMTVPPSVIATNRAQLMTLAATNVLGQNTAAIAATEAHYGEMWAQDAVAMYGYAASSAPAAQLTPFTPPPQTTNPAGQAGQTAATAHNVGSAVGSGVQSALAQLVSTAANPAAAALPAQGIEDLLALPGLSDLAGLSAVSVVGLGLSAGAWSSADLSTREIQQEQEQIQIVEYDILHAIELFSPLTPSRPGGFVPGAPSMTSAGLAEAVSVGRLSVPLNWATAAPEIRSLSYTLPLAGPTPSAATPVPLSSVGTAFSQMGLAGMGGSALAGSVSRGQGQTAGQERVRAPQGPPATTAAGDSEPSVPLTGIAAEIREFADLRDRGLITNDEYNEQKIRLLGR